MGTTARDHVGTDRDAPVKRQSGGMKIAIKACTPSKEHYLWGDTWYAMGLAKAFHRVGHGCEVHFRDAWDQADTGIDLTIHIKGLAPYQPRPNGVNVIWLISHPELHTPEELNRFDAVFCASRKYFEHIRPRVCVPCFYLPQATDDEIFRPPEPYPARDIDVLFVGNNYYRDRRRQIIDDLMATGKDYDLSIVGLNWRGAIDDRYIKGEYVHPRQLPNLYARAKIVLNDHHCTMCQWGFINDRTYNLAAVKAFQISNEVEGLESLGVATYRTAEDLREQLDHYLAFPEERQWRAEITHQRCRPFNFSEAGRHILDVVDQLRGERPAAPVAHRLPSIHTGGHVGPKVSVVMACHNGQEHLSEALDSILRQTCADWELFLLDDGSTDRTRSIMAEYARRDGRIKPFYFDGNRGPYVRRNFAVKCAAAPFVVIQDADDIMCPRKVERLHAAIASDDRLGVVGSSYRMFLDEFRSEQITDEVPLPATHEQILEAHETQEMWDFSWHGSAIIRKSLFEEIGPYDENPFGADSFWLAKAVEYAKLTGRIRLANIPEFLTLRRIHGDSQTGRLPALDPRGRRAHYWQYCRDRLRQVRDKAASASDLDVAAELRNCVCSDFFTRFKAQIIQWESEPPDGRVVVHWLAKAVLLFNGGYYVSCVRTLAAVEVMDRTAPEHMANVDLLRAMSLYALDRRDECLVYLRRETERHDSPAARQFLHDCIEGGSKADVRQWCAEHAERLNLRIVQVRPVEPQARPSRPAVARK